MALKTVHQSLLQQELGNPIYDGLSSDEAYTLLFVGSTEETQRGTGFLLTPISTAILVGIDKTEKIAGAVIDKYPILGMSIINAGLDPLREETKGFLDNMVLAGVIDAADLALIMAKAVVTNVKKIAPTHDVRFGYPNIVELIKAVGLDETTGVSFPNDVDRDDFNKCWSAVGRK